MKQLNLTANTEPQKMVKAFLEQNASDVLADKINNGVTILKDGQALINKKTLAGFMNYATQEAQKMAENGARCACIQDDVVFGWAIHYFEEDTIEENLFNLDGSKYVKATQKKAEKKAEKKTNIALHKVKKVESKGQLSFF